MPSSSSGGFGGIDPRLLRQLQQAAQSSYGPGPIKPGDRVRLVPENCPPEYVRDQSRGDDGTVLGTDGRSAEVRWDNGHTNIYLVSQIELVDESSPKKKKANAKKVTSVDVVKLDPLVLDESSKTEIIAVLKQHQNAGKLFDEWGLGETIKYGRGMTFMFYGPPGTGKTWAANCIAEALGTKLLVISAADIQSSEPGAANRNIKQAFETAHKKEQVLFIDECDSLITSRVDLGMVLASEVNTLLTEIEKFEGVAILATNRIDTMDEALERRISLIVEFPFPNEAQRLAIWTKLMPKKMPLAKEVTLEDLSKVELSGGQIKNVILQAARIALGNESKEVMAEHFKTAIRRLRKSKGLMGARSRYHQVPRQDYRVGLHTDVSTDVDIDTYLDVDTETEKDGTN